MNDKAHDASAQLTDEQLVGLYRAGETRAYELLLRRYKLELYHFLMRFVHNRATADDLFQETFLQVYTSIETFDTSRRFKPWLFTIAANKARDLLRKSSRTQAIRLSTPLDSQDQQGRSLIDLMEADLPLPEENLTSDETKAQVAAAIADLPEHLREVLLLAYFHQFPYKDIADMLGVPLGTVKSRLHAAVATFADRWKQLHGDPADEDAPPAQTGDDE
jgi:RNA polymerase sigma-70 factor (ECF subfamily)